MRFSIGVDYPVELMEASRKRFAAWRAYKFADQIPVGFCLEPRYFTPIFGLEYNEIFKNAETQFNLQLQFAKYQIEHVPSDAFCLSPVIWVHPYFDNVSAASAFGGDVRWPYNQTPQAVPVIKTVDEMEAFEIPAPDAGLFGKKIKWWHKFNELAKETKVTFNGAEGSVGVAPLSLNHLGPFMVAIDLVGADFYWWLYEASEKCHKFLQKITRGLIAAENNARKIDPRPRGAYMLAEDSSTVMSEEMFLKFTVPYTKIMFETFGAGFDDGRGMHMCGPSTHLHRALAEDLKITSFSVFGYQVKPEDAARNLGGKMYLWGNISPTLMLSGTKAEVKAAALEALEAMAPCGGFMLGDGANVCPHTPLENLAALTEASQEYSTRHPELFNRE